MKFISICNTIIRFGFYTIFFLVPLIFFGDTSELFEFNKMWLTFIVAIIIGATWIAKIIVQKQIRIQKTPLDIPLLLFLLSQTISSIFSLDRHVSWWGYYSRFNGGLLSTITYIFLYYAFASNIDNKKQAVIRMLQVSLVSGLFVSLWGLPSHFGYDPTCLLFRGTLDVSCWTDAFHPTVRIFSTMGQPDWLAAYLIILIPIAMFFGLSAFRRKKYAPAVYYFILTALFYVDTLYTKSKSGFIALAVALAIFFVGYILLLREEIKKYIYLALLAILFAIATFVIATPFDQFNKYSLGGILQHFQSVPAATQAVSQQKTQVQSTTPSTPAAVGELGGTDSGIIRSYVWKGAIDAWLHNFMFGTGVETFAFAYYKYRPAGHNLTSEWDYLYNKAHNEYLNYLATTGAFGLLTYLAFIGLYLFLQTKQLVYFFLRKLAKDKKDSVVFLETLLPFSFAMSLVTILISNFFGFSVVIVNIYLFMIPLLSLMISGKVNPENTLVFPKEVSSETQTNYGQRLGIIISYIVGLYLIAILINFWLADKQYGYGNNLDKVGQYQLAADPLHQAVASRPDEPVFKDELSVNDATLAITAAQQKDAATTNKLALEAIALSDDVTQNHPNYLVFWKSRVRVMYALAQIDAKFMPQAVAAIEKAHELAPTDAKISYNQGLLYAQSGEYDKALATLQETVRLKPDYRDAYYALGLLQRQLAVDKNNKVVNVQKESEAVATMRFILQNFNPNDTQAKDALKTWGVQ